MRHSRPSPCAFHSGCSKSPRTEGPQLLACSMNMPPEGVKEMARIIRLPEIGFINGLYLSFLKILALVGSTDRGVLHQLDHGRKIAAIPCLVFLKRERRDN